MWERALRRAAFPVAYSGGFSPHPLLSFGLALPTGCESTAEYVDVALEPVGRRVDGAAAWIADLAAACPELLGPLLPDGVEVVAAVALAPSSPSLQHVVTSCSWRIEIPGVGPAEAADRVAAAMAAPTLPVVRERKGRRQSEDLRPSLRSASVDEGDDPGTAVLLADTETRPRGVRPAELADALDLPLGRACRTHQWIDRDGSRTEPIVAGQAPTPLAVECPS